MTTARFACCVWALSANLLAMANARATSYYWDTNGVSAGIGSATSPVVWLTNSWATSSTGTTATGAWPNTQPLNSDEAVFMGTAGTVNVGADVYANALRFQSNNYAIGSTGGSLHLAGVNPSIAVNLPASNNTVTISAPLVGDAGLTLTGNSFSGGLKFLVLANTNSIAPNSFTGALTINADGALRLGGGVANEQIPDQADMSVSGVIDFITSGGASDGKQEQVRNVTVAGANANFSIGNGSNFVVNSITANATSGAGVAINGNSASVPGKLSVTGWADGLGDLVLQDGRVRINTTGATAAIGGRVLLSRNITSGGVSSVTNVNGGGGSIDTNNFTNKAFDFVSAAHMINVTDGTLTFTSAAPSHPLQVTSTNPGGTVLTKSGAGTWLWENAVETSFTGTNRVAAGAWRIGASDRLADTSLLELTGGSFDLQGFSETVGGVKLSSGTIAGTTAATLISGSNFQIESGVVETKLGGNVGLIKNTAGTATLKAANNYTGATTISNGILLVNGAPTGGSSYDVGPGGTLGGTGVVDAPVLVDGTLAPGDGIGTFTVADDVAFRAASHFAVQLDGAMADKLVVEDLDLAADQSLDVSALNAPTGSSWLIAQYSGALTDTFNTVTSGYTVDYSVPGQIILRLANGDFNFDGSVDAADYAVWRNGLGTIYTQDDYNIWHGHFGPPATSGSSSMVIVPESSSILLFVFGTVAAAWIGLKVWRQRPYAQRGRWVRRHLVWGR